MNAFLPALLDLTAIQKLAIDAASSPLTRALYARALDDFLAWCQQQRAAVLEYPRRSPAGLR